MKLFKGDFEPMYPVPHGLVILAETLEEAADIASETVMHTSTISLEEIPMDKSRVVLYRSGDY